MSQSVELRAEIEIERYGIDLGTAITRKFNAVSRKRGAKERL